jgi:uncharacterized membrane protein YfcA
MQIILGYLCAVLVGVSLGVLGSGGSILTVPIMVYLLNIKPADAIIFSLFVVGCTSVIGGFTYVRKKMVDWNIALVFAIPSIISVFITRKIILPLIPETVLHMGAIPVYKEEFTMILFAVLMMVAGIRMILPSRLENDNVKWPRHHLMRLVFVGLITGMLTGFFGVGGGFIIIPALVLFARVPIHMSVGTSLLIIAFNSFAGFTEEAFTRQTPLDYIFLLKFTAMSAIGIYTGYRISLRLKSGQLKIIFG